MTATSVRIRLGTLEDLPVLEAIEWEGDRLLIERFHAQDWPAPSSAADRTALSGFLLVAEVPTSSDGRSPHLPVGFAHVLTCASDAHLEQLSVVPDFGRRGIGRALLTRSVAESAQRGFTRMTLRTFRTVPWNADFYATHGFSESAPDTDFLRGLVDVEKRLRLDRFDARLQMSRPLP